MFEQTHLDTINQKYTMSDKDHNINVYRSEVILGRSVGPSVLELGCADGMLSPQLTEKFSKVTCVDASSIHTDLVKKKAPKAIVITSLFEKLDLNEKFDTIILGHVLEHVKEPITILKHLRQFASENTKFIITVPNANSLHRQIGVKLGILSKLNQLNEDDIKIGHRRVYFLSELYSDIQQAGMNVNFTRGIAIKPLSNSQMNSWSKDLRMAFFSLSETAPTEICGELLVEASLSIKG